MSDLNEELRLLAVHMDFFYEKSLECLRRVEEVQYTSAWKAWAFEKIRSDCTGLRVELSQAKESEASLLAWRAQLMDAKKKFNGDIDEYNGTVGSDSEYNVAEYIIAEINTCRNLIREMLRILNPQEKMYQIWYKLGDRERFLKDIGFQQGRLPEIVHMRGLLSRMKELAA